MARITENIKNAIAQFFARRSVSPAGSSSGSDADQEYRKPRTFDAITFESIVSARGQNPFPEEEGEMSFMATTMREHSLHSR